MTTDYTPPAGAPCWIDLWTSDVDGARHFYSELFDWEAQAPDPNFGGYFMFTRSGVPIAGCMGDMEGMKATDTWRMYLSCRNAVETVETAEAHGAQILLPVTPVDVMGSQAVMMDPTGAQLGVWQPGTFSGFSVIEEPGSPAWFELATRDHDRAVSFYSSVFGWDISDMPGGMTYSTARLSSQSAPMAGIMDASSFLPSGAPPQWSVYWRVEDVDASLKLVRSLGGNVVAGPDSTPFGRIATISDPTGAQLKIQSIED